VTRVSVARALPVAALAAVAWALAWVENGSTASADWLPYAFFAGLLLAAVLAGGALRPEARELAAVAALVLLAAWEALSISWSAVPPLARDEAVLTVFYAIVLLVPWLTLRSEGERLLAVAAVAAAASLLAVAVGIELRFGANQLDHFYSGRLSFPISYPNAQSAVFLIGFWPAIVLASLRRAPVVARMLAAAGATAIASGWLTAQSKGGVLAIAVSAALVFGLSPLRLRLVTPVLLAAGLTAIAYRPLTAPFRSESAGDVRHAGAAILVLTAAGAVAGLVYALVDRRLELGPRRTRIAGWAALVVFAAALAAAVAAFFSTVYHPGWLDDQWRAFKHVPAQSSASSHLLQLGSYRYDIWRVGLHQFESHPLAGIGSRGFGAAYLQHRDSPDTPARAHSVELDALSELGIVGFLLLATALVLPFVPLVGRLRARDPAGTAAFAGCSYWLVHASVDWIWTVPACGVPFFLLLGTGGAGGERRLLPGRASAAAVIAVVVLSLVAFVPPWLSARLTDQGDLAAAKTFDPLSVDPYVAKAARSPTAAGAVAALETAVHKEPRVVELRYSLALAYIRARRLQAARAELLRARRLDPGEPRIQDALKNLPKRPIRS
jgi:O-antigen ligase/polysaccharide polymerase Wzy-like membrane protein/tetratricopeptide repeat protein